MKSAKASSFRMDFLKVLPRIIFLDIKFSNFINLSLQLAGVGIRGRSV